MFFFFVLRRERLLQLTKKKHKDYGKDKKIREFLLDEQLKMYT